MAEGTPKPSGNVIITSLKSAPPRPTRQQHAELSAALNDAVSVYVPGACKTTHTHIHTAQIYQITHALRRHGAHSDQARHPPAPAGRHPRSERGVRQSACDRHDGRQSGGRADVCVLGVRGGAQLLPGHDATVPAGGQGRHVHRCGAGQTHKHNGHNTRAFCMLQHSIHQLRHTDDSLLTRTLGAFGLPGQSSGDDALRATKAAMRIHALLAKGSHKATIGVTTGKAYRGIIGSADRHEYGT